MIANRPARSNAAHTVLIVEDHDRTREAVREWLNFVFPSFELLEARNGEEALQLAAQRAPEVVLMDIELPGMKGIEAARRMKLAVPGVRVVMLSIYSAPEYRSAAAAAGAEAYVTKTTMHQELVPTLQRQLDLNGAH